MPRDAKRDARAGPWVESEADRVAGDLTVSASWRLFRRMQYSAFLAGALIYAAAATYAWRVLPWTPKFKVTWMLLYPGAYFLAALALPLAIPPVRRMLKKHIWISFRTGFGQSVISVLAVVLVLAAAAAFIYVDTTGAAHGGPFPSSAFTAYAAGVGVLLAQALLVRMIERDPTLRSRIEGAA
jgi:hypothetical protein